MVTSANPAVSSAMVTSIEGEYGPGCLGRAGAWSVATSGGAGAGPPLTVVRGDASCTLTLTSLVVAGARFDASPPIPLDVGWAPTPSSFGPKSDVAFVANAHLASRTFDEDVTLTVAVSGGRDSSASVSASSDTRACAVAHGWGTETWAGSDWGPCVAAGCDDGYRLEGGACVSYAWATGSFGACSGAPGTWVFSSWGKCSAVCGGTQSAQYTCQANTSGTQTRSVTCARSDGRRPAPPPSAARTRAGGGGP